jgi:hypothetical protein
MNKKYFDTENRQYQEEYAEHPGIKNLCRMLNFIDEKSDLWIVFELCGKPLSKQIFEVKGEFYKGERIYSVVHSNRIFELLERNGCSNFKKFIVTIAQVLHLF